MITLLTNTILCWDLRISRFLSTVLDQPKIGSGRTNMCTNLRLVQPMCETNNVQVYVFTPEAPDMTVLTKNVIGVIGVICD